MGYWRRQEDAESRGEPPSERGDLREDPGCRSQGGKEAPSTLHRPRTGAEGMSGCGVQAGLPGARTQRETVPTQTPRGPESLQDGEGGEAQAVNKRINN